MGMRPMPTPQEQADRYAKGVADKVSQYKAGIQRVNVSPTALAAQKIQKMRANFNAAIDSGKTAAGLNRVTLPAWQQQASTKGAANLATGAAAAKPKMIATLSAQRAAVEQLRNEIHNMPNDTPGDRKARANAWFDGMAAIAAQRNNG